MLELQGCPALEINEFAGSRAFKNLNIKYMGLYAQHRKIQLPKPKPMGEYAWARFLMTHVLADWTSNDIDIAIERWRGVQQKRGVVQAYAFCVEV